jgi:deoxyribodipyrimidine photo-lyase
VQRDAAPYFRIFNPTLQTKRFDPKLLYIKKWIPDFDDYHIRPIVEHKFARKRALAAYSGAIRATK